MVDLTRRRALMQMGAAAAGALALPEGLRGAPQGASSLNDELTGYLQSLHDPVIIREGDTYHVFGSGGWSGTPGVTWRTSQDLHQWTDNGPPFEAVPAWALEKIPGAKSIWAPDISFYNGLYQLYYAVSTGGSMRSVIGFATTQTLDRRSAHYGWTDHGLVVETFPGGTYNAIDPNFAVDGDGGCWLEFGSYWGGLKLLPLDPKSGKPRPGETRLFSLAYRPAPEGADNPIEGGFIFRHANWYYLFASYDYCCRGAKSNYYVAAGRSKDIRGPYVGRDGRALMEGYGTTVIIEKPWGSTRWRGPGHCGLMHDGDRDLIVYHAYDVENGDKPTLRISEIEWDAEAWPHVNR